MAVGAEIVSAFSGVADPDNFGLEFEAPKEKTHKIQYSDTDLKRHQLYADVRKMRESNQIDSDKLMQIFNQVKDEDSNWLLLLEIYELLQEKAPTNAKTVLNQLNNWIKNSKYANLIKDGLELLEKKEMV